MTMTDVPILSIVTFLPLLGADRGGDPAVALRAGDRARRSRW